MEGERLCTFLVPKEATLTPSMIQRDLENTNEDVKVSAMKELLKLTANGEQMPKILMTVIRFVVPSRNHLLKKLCLLYWEAVDKYDADGKLLPEMILVCNFLRIDLLSANEYVRGSTLRALSKFREMEILESLVAPILSCLEHRYSYVRKNAVLCIHNIYKRFSMLIPDAPERIEKHLETESDTSTARNAFAMLSDCDHQRAINYLKNLSEAGEIPSGDILPLVLVDSARKFAKAGVPEKASLMKLVFKFLQSKHTGVIYQAATTILALTSSPTAVRAACEQYVNILTKESDHNIMLIVMDRLMEVKEWHPRLLEDFLIGILRILSTPNEGIRSKVMTICMDTLNDRNVDDVVNFFKKELSVASTSSTGVKSSSYKSLLVKAIHTAALRHPRTVPSVLHVVMDFLGDRVPSVAIDVSSFVREMIDIHEDLRGEILNKLREVFPSINSARVCRIAMWLLGEYSQGLADVAATFETLMGAIGEIPFLEEQKKKEGNVADSDAVSVTSTSSRMTSMTSRVNADGTYATQLVVGSKMEEDAEFEGMNLRKLFFAGDYMVFASVSSVFTRLCFMYMQLQVPSEKLSEVIGSALLLMASLLRLGNSSKVKVVIDEDTQQRIGSCIQILSDHSEEARRVILEESRAPYQSMLASLAKDREYQVKKKVQEVVHNVEDAINFSVLKRSRAGAGEVIDFDDEMELSRAVGNEEKVDSFMDRLTRTTQLTGFSDAIFAEAHVTIHQFDLIVDFSIINQTNDTLENVFVELSTVGDLRICEKPAVVSIAPFATRKLRASIKVSSTNTGMIFGNVLYEVSGRNSLRKCVVLNEIPIDIMEYIQPGPCSELQFRTMWAEFEWENKVTINTKKGSLEAFLDEVCNGTNMMCLTSREGLFETSFLSVNLHAKSTFGEDALANVNVESLEDGKIVGFVRIRSKTQGIALALGDRVSLVQKKVAK